MGAGDLKPQLSCLLFIYLQWFLCSTGYKISKPDFFPHIHPSLNWETQREEYSATLVSQQDTSSACASLSWVILLTHFDVCSIIFKCFYATFWAGWFLLKKIIFPVVLLVTFFLLNCNCDYEDIGFVFGDQLGIHCIGVASEDWGKKFLNTSPFSFSIVTNLPVLLTRGLQPPGLSYSGCFIYRSLSYSSPHHLPSPVAVGPRPSWQHPYTS